MYAYVCSTSGFLQQLASMLILLCIRSMLACELRSEIEIAQTDLRSGVPQRVQLYRDPGHNHPCVYCSLTVTALFYGANS